MDEQPINIRTMVHHIEHLLLYSLILWQIVLGLKILIRTYFKHWTPPSNNPMVIKEFMENKSISSYNKPKNIKKIKSVVDVEIKKDIFISEADNINIKSDEVTKGKVTTQKDKLKSLRGKI